jgi:zinc transport system substrate-binding protein
MVVMTDSRPGRRLPRRRTASLALLASLLAPLVLGACASSGQSSSSSNGRIQVVTSFYPLQFVARRVTGNQADVTSLTKPGAEPHDLELTPRDVSRVAKGDLVVYLKGFQPSVDDAVKNEAPDKAFDAARYANLDRTYVPIEGGVKSNQGAIDPHFWLDPQRLSAVAQQSIRRTSSSTSTTRRP